MEDVQHMIAHASEQSFMFILDSRTRNQYAYPSASEYYIPFPQPFKNVFSVDLVDATIPRTEYSVDEHSNTLSYAPGTYTTYEHAQQDQAIVNAAIPPGDYNTATLIQYLNTALKNTALQQGHAPLVAVPSSNPVDITNKLIFTRSEPFTLFMNVSTMRHVLGFGAPASQLNNDVNWDRTLRYTTDTNVSNDVFKSVESVLATAQAFVGPVPIQTTDYRLAVGTGLRQRFVSRSSGILTSVVVRGSAGGTETLTGRIVDMTFDPPALVQTFSVVTSSTSAEWTATLAPTSQTFAVSQATAGDVDGTPVVTLTTSQPHGLDPNELITISGATTTSLNNQWVLLSASGSTLVIAADIPVPIIGRGIVYASKEILEQREYAIEFDSAASVFIYKALAFSDETRAIERFAGITGWTTESLQDSLCLEMTVTSVGHKVDAPGQCNLTGEPYVCIRSPNIEQHMHRDLAVAFNTMSPGLGMVRLGGNAGGYRQERLNFLSYDSRKFHPIGKLHGIHIRLETPSRRLYNTHGIDHTMLVSVKMYGPGVQTVIPKTLYPDYEPDTRKSLVKQLERERDSACRPYS